MNESIAQLNAALVDRYAVDREIGAGGMAVVYLARDVKHDRQVALKVLNPELGAVLGVERFLAEIKVTANLQHPNLLPLFDSGEANGLLFYVMPYVDGESLRARLEREKQFPVDEAVRIAVAIANALHYAHAHGVIHRDLKPENILLQAGQPVIADFGIALAVSKAGGSRITQTGLSLGTPLYMSPEQATGDRVVDGRSDIYSLAAMTYEMLTGEPPHTGSTAQAIIARVLTDKPRPIRASRSAVPEHVEAALEHALEKLPADRFSSAHDFAEALTDKSGAGASRATVARAEATRVRERSWRSRLRDPVVLGLGVLTIASLGVASSVGRQAPVVPALRPIRFFVSMGDSLQQGLPFPWPAAISPDGGTIVFSGRRPPKEPQLYALRTDQLEPQPIPGTEFGSQPLFSPDGQWVEFEAGLKEKKVRLDGSAPVNISSGGGNNGAAWTTSNELVLGAQGKFRGLSRVSVAGGEAVVLTTPDSAHGERNHLWPTAFPDGKTIAFVLWYGELSSSRLALVSLDDRRVVPLDIRGIRALAVVDGRLVYVQADGAVMAVSIDAARKRALGGPIPVHDPVPVVAGNNGNSDVFVSSGGAIVTAQGGAIAKGELGWFERGRAFAAETREVRGYFAPRRSPDGKRIAVVIADGQGSDVWINDLATATLSRITTIGSVNCAEWTRDSRSLLVASRRGEFWLQPAVGASPARLLGRMKDLAPCGTLSPDGRSIVVNALTDNTWDLWTLPVDSGAVPKRYIATPALEWAPRFSPDGKWIAFDSDESGSPEVYLRSFPDPSSKVQVSAGGGHSPIWLPDGKRIVYSAGDAIIRAVTTGAPAFQVLSRDTIVVGAATFAIYGNTANYDVPPDGRRVLAARTANRGARLIAVPNWITEFRERIRAAGGK